MAASGLSSKGTVLSVSGTTIARIYSLDVSDMTKNPVETTDLSDSWTTVSPSAVRDGGELALGIRYDPADSTQGATTGLMYHFSNEVVPSCVITWPDGNTLSFSGVVTSFGISASYDSALDANVGIKITGEPSFS